MILNKDICNVYLNYIAILVGTYFKNSPILRPFQHDCIKLGIMIFPKLFFIKYSKMLYDSN